MSKNKKMQMRRIFGRGPMPAAGSSMRARHMGHIQAFFERMGIESRVTKGKYNKAGKHIHKPDWTKGVLEYEPNPDAAVHEFAHLWLAPMGASLADVQRDMDAQFGFVISQYGFMKQKRSLFEILPMGMEQKLRRRLGMPVSQKRASKARTCVETGELAGPVLPSGEQVLRSARMLDKGCLRRLALIDLGILVFGAQGWQYSDSIDARINARALRKGARV